MSRRRLQYLKLTVPMCHAALRSRASTPEQMLGLQAAGAPAHDHRAEFSEELQIYVETPLQLGHPIQQRFLLLVRSRLERPQLRIRCGSFRASACTLSICLITPHILTPCNGSSSLKAAGLNGPNCHYLASHLEGVFLCASARGRRRCPVLVMGAQWWDRDFASRNSVNTY